jgi:hypothetical protein
MELRIVPIVVSVMEDPGSSSMEESIHSNLSLLNNNLELPSYLWAILSDCQQTGRGVVASTLLFKRVIDSTAQVDLCTIYLFVVSSKAHKDDSRFVNKKKKMVKEKDTPKPKVEGNRKNFHHRSARNAGPARKEFITKVAGLENHTFDVGNSKYAA